MKPKSFQHIFSLLNLSYVDLISAPNYFYKNFKHLLNELYRRINDEHRYDISNSIKLLMVPNFGGFDGELTDFAADNNAYDFYSD